MFLNRKVVTIDENICIGCGKCLPACPVDAIIGAPQHMHTIIEDECTGCALCIDPCPVDCIHLEQRSLPDKVWRIERATQTKKRVEAKAKRKTSEYYEKRPSARILDRVDKISSNSAEDRKAEMAEIMKRMSKGL